jgi:DNA-binding response OmpR family regulator
MATILTVDDDVQIRELLRDGLAERGHTVVAAPALDQASALLSTRPVDLVILDLSFPEGSGQEWLQQFRAHHATLPVVVFSGSVSGDLEKSLRMAGATEVLSKGVSLTRLVAQVERILGTAQRLTRPGIGEPRTLLVVDDEAPVRAFLRDCLAAKRYRILEAQDGVEAVELAQRERPDVVLLDVQMPRMDGLEALKRLLALNPAPGVVMATGRQDDETVRQAIEAGAYGYVLKPFDLLYLELVVAAKLLLAARQ